MTIIGEGLWKLCVEDVLCRYVKSGVYRAGSHETQYFLTATWADFQ